MLRFTAAIAMAGLIASTSLAAPCRDAKGHFAKCPPAGAAGMPSATVKDKNGKCHWSATENGHTKGQFTKC